MHRLLHFPPQRMARQDAEVAVDIDNDGADGPAADQGGNLLGRGQVGETRIGSLGWRGVGGLYEKTHGADGRYQQVAERAEQSPGVIAACLSIMQQTIRGYRVIGAMCFQFLGKRGRPNLR